MDSFELNEAWRFRHAFFHLDPLEATYNISNQTFMWFDGIFSIALSPVEKNGHRTAYFHALSR